MFDYPAINGQVVTERHARLCATEGHKTYTVAGVDQHTCPRCGRVEEIPAELPIAKFERMLHLEWSYRVSSTVEYFSEGKQDKTSRKVQDQSELFEIMASLTSAEVKAYGEWRKAKTA